LVLASKEQFLEFQRKYNKVYSNEEFHQRFLNFEENLKEAKELTIKNNGSARFGMTKFSDLSKEEFGKYYLMKNLPKTFPKLPKAPIPPKGVNSPDPTNYDWGSAGVLTPVYNQEQCGSCWAFSATETIESYYAIAGNTLTSLSMEQIVDCDTSDDGCNGGYPANAYQYVQGAGGLEDFNDYPYDSGGQQCQFNSAYVVSGTANFQASSISGESGIYQQLSSGSGGPVSVCVDANSWQSYQGGVLTSCGDSIDHCVQATGYYYYGQSGAYWNVRNSWGGDWGENGYIWVAIGSDLCAIGDQASVVAFS